MPKRGGALVYQRVKDKATGHVFDVLASDKRIGVQFEPVKGEKPSRFARPAKHNPLPSTAKSVVAAKSEKKEA